MRVITFGTFDLFHRGHLNVLKFAKSLGTHLSVGVSSDALNFNKKGVFPVYDQNDRLDLIRELKMVDDVFLEESLEDKRNYIVERSADILVMGDDWAGKFDFLQDICKVMYVERTPSISSTLIKAEIFNKSR